jgi:hypothetical protein
MVIEMFIICNNTLLNVDLHCLMDLLTQNGQVLDVGPLHLPL